MSEFDGEHNRELVRSEANLGVVPYLPEIGLAAIGGQMRHEVTEQAREFKAWLFGLDGQQLPPGVERSGGSGSVDMRIKIGPQRLKTSDSMQGLLEAMGASVSDRSSLIIAVTSNECVDIDKDQTTISVMTIDPDDDDLPGFKLRLYPVDPYKKSPTLGGLLDKQCANFSASGRNGVEVNQQFRFSMLKQDILRSQVMREIRRAVAPKRFPIDDKDSVFLGLLESVQGLDERLDTLRNSLRNRSNVSERLEVDPLDERVSPLLRSVLLDWGIPLDQSVIMQVMKSRNLWVDQNPLYIVMPYALTPDNAGFIYTASNDQSVVRSSGFTSISWGGALNAGGSVQYNSVKLPMNFTPPRIYRIDGSNFVDAMYKQIEIALADTALAYLPPEAELEIGVRN